jgi:hypothetical protein
MPTFIKTGFWEKTKKGYREWLNLDQFVESKIPSPTYKVFTALLTQSGGDDAIIINSGVLTIGVTYQIVHDGPIPGDFTNVGAPNNNDDTFFIATGTIPNNWGNYNLRYNTGAPVATILENTIGNVWFSYSDIGYYSLVSNGLFISNKTTQILNSGITSEDGYLIVFNGADPNLINLSSQTGGFNPQNDGFNNTPIEIRVYN